MRILYITNGINGSGGLERVLSNKCSFFVKNYKYDIAILTVNGGNESPFYFFDESIKFFDINYSASPMKFLKSYIRGVQKVLDDYKPDIISVCDDGIKGFFLPKFLKTKAKFIYERHASIYLNTSKNFKGKFLRTLMRSQVKNFDSFIVLTSSNVKEWNNNNVTVISNPLSFSIDVKSKLLNKSIIAVGSHSFNKGYDILLEIWKDIERIYPDWKLNIYGKIDKEKVNLKLCESLELKNVKFHTPEKNIKSKFLDSSIMVLPSRSEGFGMVLIEAMACGVPCISFDCPSGPADIITDNFDGLLVEQLDAVDFKNKIISLINSYDLRKYLGDNAIVSSEKYDIKSIADIWRELFTDIVNENSI